MFVCFWPYHAACGTLVSWPGIKSASPADPALQADFLPLSHQVSLYILSNIYQIKYKIKYASNYIYIIYYIGEGNGTPLQYSCLENPMGRGAWWAAVHGVAKSRTRLSNFTFTFHFHALEKEMATHSSVLAWRIPGTGEPGGLPFMGSHRVGYD